MRADVTNWADQVALFKFALDTYGQIDIVVANAGVAEVGEFDPFGDIKEKEPTKPIMVTPNVNVTGVLYSEYHKSSLPCRFPSVTFATWRYDVWSDGARC